MRELQEERRLKVAPDRFEEIKRMALQAIAASEKPRISWEFYASVTNYRNGIQLGAWNAAVAALEDAGLVEVVWSGGEYRSGLCQFQATPKGKAAANA
jgi:hypothetical protein